MLIIILISIFYSVRCHVIPLDRPVFSDEIKKCVTDIVSQYYAPKKLLTYVGNKLEDGELLEAIHNLNIVAITSKQSSIKLHMPHEGYLIAARNYSTFVTRFPKLIKESNWNPEARFLIIVRSLEYSQLEDIFNILLKQHVNNVLVVNASAESNLYSYNPFDNYGCGKYYDDIITYGECSQAQKYNLYPKKYVTGLHNCTFDVVIDHWPPYTILPANNSDTSSHLSYGAEPYLLRLVGKIHGFSLNIIVDTEDRETTSSVSSDMEADGSLRMLQENKADINVGGLLLVPSRAVAFNYVFDFFPYVDEIRFLVRQARLVPTWKNIYIEFDSTIWVLIVLSTICYSMLMIILLRAEDKSIVALKLFDNLMLHGCKINCQSTVKCVFIIWVWFAYLVNAFYQSSLVSLTANPARQKQISTEADILHHKLKPCFSEVMQVYHMESTQSNQTRTTVPGCKNYIESIQKVIDHSEYYTIFLYGLYTYNRQDFFDVYGHAHIYALKKAYSKIMYCMYFYKGFPLLHDIRLSALRMREMGLVDKALSDLNYLRIIQHHFQAKEYKPRFTLPWRLYILGCSIAGITLIVELLSKHKH